MLYSTVRSKKVAFVQEWYTKYGNKVEIVAQDDLIHGDYSAAFKGPRVLFYWVKICSKIVTGVEAVIHAAAPLVGREASHADAINVRTIFDCPIVKC